MGKQNQQVMHVLRGNAFAVDRGISQMLQRSGTDYRICIADVNEIGEQATIAFNREWVDKVPTDRFCGVLEMSAVVKRAHGRWQSMLKVVWIEYAFRSLRKLLVGPRVIVFHGTTPHPIMLLVLRMFGKRLVYVHWGRKMVYTKSDLICCPFLNMYNRILVLMSPELRYFKFISAKRLVVMPYPDDFPYFSKDDIARGADDQCILVGNSAWYINGYKNLLAKFSRDDWKRITFMLPYGNEGNANKVQEFVDAGKAALGQRFDPWTEILPPAEYVAKIRKYEYYCCVEELQTGLGIIYNSILSGKTLILAGDNYQWLSDLGIKVFDFKSVSDFSVSNLRRLKLSDEQKIRNAMLLINRFRNEFGIEKWCTIIRGVDA